ncbi:hypothetical protein GCM10022255_109170 [Dactylosporangium darangshiense]|uniref:Integrase catalytic domain-containing protein n=1 Tax=Dactylosporangium darangshiense TaxID=579108 RepID=A0ABP8DUD3_9ACTN
MKSRLAVNAVHNAVARRGDVAGCVLHTDRGSQFRSRKFIRALHQHHMIGSMGTVGAAGDNAAMESFFGLLQNNVLDLSVLSAAQNRSSWNGHPSSLSSPSVLRRRSGRSSQPTGSGVRYCFSAVDDERPGGTLALLLGQQHVEDN